MSKSSIDRTEVFVRINQQSTIDADKLHLNLDVVAVRNGNTVPNQQVVLEVDGKRKTIVIPEGGRLEGEDIVFDIKCTRAKLRAYIDAEVVTEYEIFPQDEDRGSELSILSAKEKEMFEELEQHYDRMMEVLTHYKIPTSECPRKEKVLGALKPEILSVLIDLCEPRLLLVSPENRMMKMNALDSNRRKKQDPGHIYDVQDNNLWNGGNTNVEKQKWRVGVVEGKRDGINPISINATITRENIKDAVKKYRERGFDVVNDADTYLTLMMLSLAEDRPIDFLSATVLNGKNITNSSPFAFGRYTQWVKGKGMAGRIWLVETSHTTGEDHLRPIIWLDVN